MARRSRNGKLSVLAAARQQVPEAGRLCLRALTIFRKDADAHNAQLSLSRFHGIHESVPPSEKRELEDLWIQAGLGPPPRENSRLTSPNWMTLTARRILAAIARSRSRDLPPNLAGLRGALAAEFGPARACARPRHIEAMALEDPPLTRQTFDTGTTIAIGSAAYYAVASAIDIKYVNGRWSIKLEKKAADSATVRALVQKLLGYLP